MVPLKSDYWFWDYHLEPKLLLQVLGCVCFSSVTKPWCMYGLVIPTTFQFRIRNPPYWVLTNDYVACLKVCTSLSRELHKSPIFILFTGTVKPLKEVPLYVLTKFHQVIKLLDDCLKDKLQFPCPGQIAQTIENKSTPSACFQEVAWWEWRRRVQRRGHQAQLGGCRKSNENCPDARWEPCKQTKWMEAERWLV